MILTVETFLSNIVFSDVLVEIGDVITSMPHQKIRK